MCEAHAYIIKEGREEELLDSVDQVEFEEDTVKLVNIFGEQRILKGRLLSYNNTERKLVFESL